MHVKIGPEFFAKVKLDYANWRWALAREFLQNCFDAPGSKRVEVMIKLAPCGSKTGLEVFNDGQPMDETTLTTKLLTLGGSGKNFEGEATGGFGVAKSLLYYTHLGYSIHTGSLLVTGCGAEYGIEQAEYLKGTLSKILLEGDQMDRLLKHFARFASYSQWKGQLFLNGVETPCNLHKGSRRKDLGWGIIYTNKSASQNCVVRLNGQPMFFVPTQYKGLVVVELTGKAKDTLTSNRDGLLRKYADALTQFLVDIAIDKRSALREQRAEYKRWLGEKQKHEAQKPKAAGDVSSILGALSEHLATEKPEGTPEGESSRKEAPQDGGGHGGISVVVESRQDQRISIGPEFILKNTTGKKPPAKLIPGEKFAGQPLVLSWAAICLRLYQLLGVSGTFSVGFLFDEENEAESEMSESYGQVYYVNPLQDGKLRYADVWASRSRLISLAAHEIVHGAFGLRQHDEDYAAKLTEVMEIVVTNAYDLCGCIKRVLKEKEPA